MNIPPQIKSLLAQMRSAGYEAYLVGGCVRDLLLGREPKDWDITTIAKPEEILRIFPSGKYENSFGTVLVPMKSLLSDQDEQESGVVEITTYRSESRYQDHRHPEEVKFEDELDKDLERRDFTINALALGLDIEAASPEIIDLFGGQKDLRQRIIRAVGEPEERFKEDGLRLLRAIRLSAELDFALEPKTERAISKLAGSLKFIAPERIRDELIKIFQSPRPSEAVARLASLKLLNYIIPELVQAIGVNQNRHHIHTVFKHCLLSLKYCPNPDWRVRLAALLHDIGKPRVKKMQGTEATFYNHDILGAKMTEKILRRLKFSQADSAQVVNLVRNHMFYYNVGEVTEASVRRLIAKVGKENLRDLIDLRIADRLGSCVPKAKPYKLRHLEYLLDKVQSDPVSVKMLKINGHDLMELLKIPPGPVLGAILDVLLSEVIEDPARNNRDYLSLRAVEIFASDWQSGRQQAKNVIAVRRQNDEAAIKAVHWVK